MYVGDTKRLGSNSHSSSVGVIVGVAFLIMLVAALAYLFVKRETLFGSRSSPTGNVRSKWSAESFEL